MSDIINSAIKIETEDQAFALLDDVISGRKSIDLSKVEFGDWLNLRIRLKGEDFHSNLTPTIMRGILELQTGVYRSYAVLKFGDDSTRHLTDQERHDLEFAVKVSEGSSLFDIDFQALIETLLKESVGKMSPDQVFVLVIITIFGLVGYKGWNHFVSKKSEERLAEIEGSTKTEAEKIQAAAQLDTVKLMVENNAETARLLAESNTENMRIFTSALTKYPEAKKINEINQDAKVSLVRALAAAEPEQIEIQNIEMSVGAAREMTTNQRARWNLTRLDGVFQILHIDYSNLANLRIKIRRTSDGYELTAILQDDTMEKSFLEIIHQSAQDRKPVQLTINASQLGEEYKDATIIAAAAHIPE